VGALKKIAKTQYCYLFTLLINKPLEKARLEGKWSMTKGV
jgi:hypothetical protein